MLDNPIPSPDAVESMLAQFSMAFTVRDLMTPTENLIRADTAHEARMKHRDHGYDVIPHPNTGPLTGYYYCGGDLMAIAPEHLVSDGTSLLDLLNLLSAREYYFVLRGNEISGYVHFSDLNKSLMRTPFYVLMEATERHLLTTVRQAVTEDNVKTLLLPNRVLQLNGYLKNAMKTRADTSLWDVLGLRDVFDIAIRLGLARISETESLTVPQAEAIVKFRNSIAHSGLPLVENHSAVARLVSLRQQCTQLRLLNVAVPQVRNQGQIQ